MHAEAVGGAKRVTRDWMLGRWWLAALNTGTQGDGMVLARRTVVWLWLTAVGGVLAVMLAGMITWYQLPRWAPEWVIEHSPFVEPYVRAIAHSSPTPTGTPEARGLAGAEFDIHDCYAEMDRMKAWGTAAVPVLERCLDQSDRALRIHAFRLLGIFGRLQRAHAKRLVTDRDPWMRAVAWLRMTTRDQGSWDEINDDEAKREAVDAALALLQDPDQFLCTDARDYLSGNPEFLWDQRERLYESLKHENGPSFLAKVITELCAYRVWSKPNELLPEDLLFPLLAVAQHPDAGDDRGWIFDVWLKRIRFDPVQIHRRLSAMNDGVCAWEPGAQPWMYEHLHRLCTNRVTVSLREVETKELTRACFPNGNVLISPQIIGPNFPSVTLDMQDRPAIELLLELARILKAHLHLDHGVAKLVKWEDYHQGNGISPTLPITISPGVDRQHPAIQQWQRVLQMPCSFRGMDADLPSWFEEQSRRLGMMIDLQEVDWAGQFDELHFQDLPLAQILQFVANARFLRLELDLSGIRLLPE